MNNFRPVVVYLNLNFWLNVLLCNRIRKNLKHGKIDLQSALFWPFGIFWFFKLLLRASTYSTFKIRYSQVQLNVSHWCNLIFVSLAKQTRSVNKKSTNLSHHLKTYYKIVGGAGRGLSWYLILRELYSLFTRLGI